MKHNFLKAVTLIFASSFAITSNADDKIDAKIQQLKVNYENSEHNHKEYKKNLNIVENNIKEIEKVSKDLKSSREEIKNQLMNSEKNKQLLVKQKDELKNFVVVEEQDLKKEQEAIDKLKTKIADLEKNQEKRRLNIATYNEKMKEIDVEVNDWDSQLKKIAELDQYLVQRQTEANNDRKNWDEKLKTYSSEEKKWNDQYTNNKMLYKKYEKLSN